MSVITRFAPSPTGILHVGNMRTALINWLYARAHGGKFILRIDDTDNERSKDEYETQIKKDMRWMHLQWDKTFNQKDRTQRYEEAKNYLISIGKLYPCYETPEELNIKRNNLLRIHKAPIYDRAALQLSDEQKQNFEKQGIQPHWRYKLDHSDITWVDEVRGPITVNTSNISDPILIRSNGTMTYLISSVCDDIDYNITHIIRGEDHITNSAIHIQMFRDFKSNEPSFSHISLLKLHDSGLSKRYGDQCSIRRMRQKLIDPYAILSYLSSLGTDTTGIAYNSLDDIIKVFALDNYGKGTVTFDTSTLEKINKYYLHNYSYAEAKNTLMSILTPSKGREAENKIELFWNLIKGNLSSYQEAINWWDRLVEGKFEQHLFNEEDKKYIQTCIKALNLIPDHNIEFWTAWINGIKQNSSRKGKNLFIPIRMALTGTDDGPELKGIAHLLGKTELIDRMEKALIGNS